LPAVRFIKVIGSEAFFAGAGLGFAIFFLGLSGDAAHGLAVRYSTESNPRYFSGTTSETGHPSWVAFSLVSYVVEEDFAEMAREGIEPRHADFQDVSGRSLQVCPDRLATVQQQIAIGPWSIGHY
jgi:hypothetical protein